jgi:hypothetical protein
MTPNPLSISILPIFSLRTSLTRFPDRMRPGSSRASTTRSHYPLKHRQRAILAILFFLFLCNLASKFASPR